MITDKLRQYLADEIKDKVTSGQIGYGGNSTDPTSTTLDVPSGVSVLLMNNQPLLMLLKLNCLFQVVIFKEK